jgi:hypothetical protein
MKKILFTNKFLLVQSVFLGKKTQTRRIATFENIDEPNIGTEIKGKAKGRKVICRGLDIIAKSRYCIGEVVAIAQPYRIVNIELAVSGESKEPSKDYEGTAGWKNPLYVRADEMLHHIKIMRIRVERLQDISDEDCIKEGIPKSVKNPRQAFTFLIDKVCGKNTWKRNPLVFVYEFKLID